jgi:hypothetical protein
MDQETKAWE